MLANGVANERSGYQCGAGWIPKPMLLRNRDRVVLSRRVVVLLPAESLREVFGFKPQVSKRHRLDHRAPTSRLGRTRFGFSDALLLFCTTTPLGLSAPVQGLNPSVLGKELGSWVLPSVAVRAEGKFQRG